jgi:CheY-like chemotaxis protein/HPt (histidine-containing phosphotransfer) domain-containing protein
LKFPIADSRDLVRTDPQAERALASTTARMRRVPPSVPAAEKEGTLVLIVDDHPTNRALLVRQVNALGYAAESADHGLEALARWKSGRFAIVITDCNMPEMDGYELSRSVRGIEGAEGRKRTPISACTANALGGEAERCFEAGMDDYLVKPVELSKVLEKLDRWLPIPRKGPPTFAGSASPRVAPAADSPVDRSVLAGISAGDFVTERRLLTQFRRVNDQDAATFNHAVVAGDIPSVSKVAHRMLGATRVVGALPLALVCEQIEHASREGDWTAISASVEPFQREWTRLNTYLDSV